MLAELVFVWGVVFHFCYKTLWETLLYFQDIVTVCVHTCLFELSPHQTNDSIGYLVKCLKKLAFTFLSPIQSCSCSVNNERHLSDAKAEVAQNLLGNREEIRVEDWMHKASDPGDHGLHPISYQHSV